jgi:AraC-like DNA-binding protein
MGTSPARGAATPSPLDFDREWERAAHEAGTSRTVSRSVVRTIYTLPGGSGTADVVRLDEDALVNVINCVLPRMARWAYDTHEPMIMLRASLACDVRLQFGSDAAIVFNRPEVVLACLPSGLPMSADIAGGARQQGIVATFRAATFAKRFGLRDEDLPPEVRDALGEAATFGRIASFPVDHRVAALIADTLDSRLHGELRVVQVAGRVAELVAYALDAMLSQQPAPGPALQLRRDFDLAHAALVRLDRDYRRPPPFGDLAREIGTNQNKLKVLFKQAFGMTMADYCLGRRVREAQQLLLEASLTIAQVAERVGYEHQSSFTAAFRGHVGMSPREYRRHRAPFSLALTVPGPTGSPRVAGRRGAIA